jgi:hypothetical protein
MRKIIGIIAILLLSIMLGLSVNRLNDGRTTLVSEYSWRMGGVYG